MLQNEEGDHGKGSGTTRISKSISVFRYNIQLLVIKLWLMFEIGPANWNILRSCNECSLTLLGPNRC